MAFDIQSTTVVRKKLATFKSKIKAADKRAERAKESLQHVEESFNRTMGLKAKLDDQICKRDSQRDRVETLIASQQSKWKALIRFREETNCTTPKEEHGGQHIREIDTKIATFTKQAKIAERKYKASVDREHALLGQTVRARERCTCSETTASELHEQLLATQERVYILEQRQRSRNTRELQIELLEDKVRRTLARAQERENLEAYLENRIIDLEDQIEMYTKRTKRALNILSETAERENHKSMEPWTITLWLRRSSLVNGTSISNFAASNGKTTKDDLKNPSAYLHKED